MGVALDKTLEYSKLFLFGSKPKLIIAITAFICIVMKTILKLSLQWVSNKIFYPSETNSKNVNDMLIYIPVSIFYMSTIPCLEIVSHIFENSFMAEMFNYLYKKFLEYQFVDWNSIIRCDIYSAIIRRTKGTIQFFKELAFGSVDNLMYCAIGIIRLLILYGFPSYFVLGFLMAIFFPAIVNLITILKKQALRKSNEAHDLAETRIKDIFLNYEMIRTYNTFDIEVEKYKRSTFEWEFWLAAYWFIDNVVVFSNRIMRTLLFFIMIKRIKDEGMNITADVIDQMKTFQSIFKRMSGLTTNIKLVIEAAENMTNSKLDELKGSKEKRLVKIDGINKGIDVKGMRVKYGERVVFEEVYLSIKKGDKIAITGPNGSGKSTFVRALLGIESHEGVVLIDGVDRMLIESNSLGRMFSYVPQDPAVFEATVKNNITCFDNTIKEEDLLKRIEEYGIGDEMKMMGYDTMLVEKGKNISAAQRQKICFLRAAFRDTAVIVFDEMTSEMDEKYELDLINLVMEKMRDRTIVMIIHNLTVLDKFDGIIFFNRKTAVGCKTYEELIREDEDFRLYCTGKKDS